MSTIDTILAARGSRYGKFSDHAEITQSIKFAMAAGRNWDTIDDDMKEALEMVAHKIGRILNGDPQYIDSWTDIVGYTRLVEKRLLDEQAPTCAPVKDNVVPLNAAKPEPECDCMGCVAERVLGRIKRGNA